MARPHCQRAYATEAGDRHLARDIAVVAGMKLQAWPVRASQSSPECTVGTSVRTAQPILLDIGSAQSDVRTGRIEATADVANLYRELRLRSSGDRRVKFAPGRFVGLPS